MKSISCTLMMPAEVVAATSSESDAPEGIPAAKPAPQGLSSDRQATATQPVKARGRGRDHDRARRGRGSAGRGTSAKATAGRAKPHPPTAARGRGAFRGRGRGRKAPATLSNPAEEALPPALQPSEPQPPPEPAQPPPKTAAPLLPEKSIVPDLVDDIAMEASMMELAASQLKAKRPRGRTPRNKEGSSREQSTEPLTIAESQPAAAAEGKQVLGLGKIPGELPAVAQVDAALENPTAALSGKHTRPMSAPPTDSPQPSKAVQIPMELLQSDSGPSIVNTDHFVRRSSRYHDPELGNLLQAQPAAALAGDSSILDKPSAIQTFDAQAQQEDSNAHRLASASGEPIRASESAKDQHKQPETVPIAPPASSNPALAFHPEASSSPKPRGRGGRGRGRGRGRQGGRSKTPGRNKSPSEEPSLPIAAPVQPTQAAAEAVQAEPEAILAQAEEMQPQLVSAAKVPATISEEPQMMMGQPLIQPPQTNPTEVTKRGIGMATAKKGKKFTEESCQASSGCGS